MKQNEGLVVDKEVLAARKKKMQAHFAVLDEAAGKIVPKNQREGAGVTPNDESGANAYKQYGGYKN